jgi:hypothetical protein
MANINNEKRADKKARLRREAEERQAAYDKLSPIQKLEKLDAGNYRAKKQRKKLEDKILKDK